jgi:hypothetical protein
MGHDCVMSAGSSTLSADDMPQVFNAADQAAADSRRRYMSQTAMRLVLSVAAAALGIRAFHIGTSAIDWAALGSSVAFFIALLVDVSLLNSQPQRSWYDGRALAESAKTLAWKWSVCGNPYPRNSDADAVLLLANDLRDLRVTRGDVALAPIVGRNVTDAMSSLRASSLAERKSAYLAGRIDDQLSWYSNKSRTSNRAARRWRLFLLFLEGLGGVAGLLKATAVIDVPIDALIATGMGAVGAWLEAQQHDQISRAYSVAVADLTDARVRLESCSDEDAWAEAVNDAEDAISREHTRWRASRSQP